MLMLNVNVTDNLQVSDHLVSLSDIVSLQPHPRQSASLHEVDQHVTDGLEVVPPALFYTLAWSLSVSVSQ